MLRRERKAKAQAEQQQQGHMLYEPMNYHLGHESIASAISDYVASGNGDGGAVKDSDLCQQQQPGICNKRQLILNTIEDLKRSLEDQSIELCGLNDD